MCVLCIFLISCVGCFDDEDVTHVDGDINPVRDLETISQELRLKDEQFVIQRIVSSNHSNITDFKSHESEHIFNSPPPSS